MFVSPLVPADRDRVLAIADAAEMTVDLDAELARPFALLWVARARPFDPPSAFLLAWAVVDELHLIHIATDPKARRKGAARALMEALVDRATEHKSRLVLLEVRRSNRAAIRLYRSVGFSAMGVRRTYYTDGEDAVEMMLTLDPMTGAVRPGRDEVELLGA
jgi:[ribosomal protein S18]-alanine N-acetyltransferase